MDNKNELTVFSPEQVQMISGLIRDTMGPLVEAMANIMQNNTDALNRLASAQQIQADRVGALEKQVRLNTPVNRQHVKYINEAIRAHARELLDKRGISDAKAINRLSGFIRKSVLSRYGISALSEVPRHEYSVVMSQVETWNDMLTVRDIVKEARSRNEATGMEGTEPAAGGCGAPQGVPKND